MTPKAERLPLWLKIGHGLGSVAYGVKDNGFSTFLLIFYSQVVGLDPRLVSLALMVALLVDSLIDPVIGHLSDRTYSRWGRRHPWLYLAPVPLGLSWMLLWSPPANLDHAFLYLMATAILVRTLVSCCEVPSQSLVAELTSDYDERTSLTRFRYLFGWGGGLLVYFLANTVFLKADATHEFGQLNPDGYWNYGLAGAVLIVAAVLISALAQHSRVARLPAIKPTESSMGHAITEMFESLKHPAALVLLGASIISISSTQMTFTISNYLYLFVWEFSESNFAWLPWLLFGGVIATFMIVSHLHRRFGKRETAIVAAIISVVFWVVPFALRSSGHWPELGTQESALLLFTFLLISNINAVIVSISGQSMMADVVEASYQQTGRRTEGVFAAGWVFVQKCGTAFGIGITGFLVDWSGLPRKAIPGQVDALVIDKLTFAYCVIVVVAAILATWILAKFPISRADHEARLRELAVKSD